MDGLYKSNEKTDPPSWYGSKASFASDVSKYVNVWNNYLSICLNLYVYFLYRNGDIPMTYQSKDPIITLPIQDKEKNPNSGVGGTGGSHGLVVEHPTSYVHLFNSILKYLCHK